MLRLIHSQTVPGGILVDDIDDGLPNKTAHRLSGDPKAYKRDGYANEPKQKAYIPRTKPGAPSVAGYIDLKETQRVLMSAASGKILGLQTAGQITVVSMVQSDLNAPTVTDALLDDPAANDVTIDGTGFLSTSPEITTVRLFGPGVGDVTLTKAQIEAVAPGAVTNTEIIIDSTLIASLAPPDKIIVTADAQASNTFTLQPIITTATIDTPATGDLTIDGEGLDGTVVSVRLFGAGVGDITLTKAEIEAVPPGAVGDTQIIIDTTIAPSLAAGDEVTVTVDGVLSDAETIV